MQYKKPDGSFDQTKILALPEGTEKHKNDETASLMGGIFNYCKLSERHGWVIGIAANKVIDNKHFKCDVILNRSNKSCSL